jgi:A/G-specific adenine glycosylase
MNTSIRRKLLAWFDRERRDLPWRLDRDPYRIWVSEVMLQQTQVTTVISYFERFITAFPTLKELAEADEQEVLKLWQGLGYYRRACNLHHAAQVLFQSHGTEIPEDITVWESLPGIGRYILGAVLSQAFEVRLPILEANTKRLLTRYYGYRGDLNDKATQDWLWDQATKILPRKRVGDFNQSLMELGALVCTPKRPQCNQCPLAKVCVANQSHLQEEIPVKSPKRESEEVREVAVVIRQGKKVLLCQRPSEGRWAKMWEFPHVSLKEKEDHIDAATRILQEVVQIRAELGEEIQTIHHTVTRFRISMVCLEASYLSGHFASDFYTNGKWIEPKEFGDYPISTPQRILAKTLSAPVRQRRLF